MYRASAILFAIIGTSFAQEIFDGNCPPVEVVKPFNGTRFAGSWYEWARFSSKTETGSKCNVAQYEFNVDGSVRITSVFIDSAGNRISLEGSSILPRPVGQLNVTIPQFGPGTMDYSILGTDYDNWASLFVCKDLADNQHQENKLQKLAPVIMPSTGI